MTSEPGTLLLRADASLRIGTGHVMRCLALAQAWQDVGGHAVLASAESVPALEARLANEGVQVLRLTVEPGGPDDASETAERAAELGARWVVLDGYHFSGDYQRLLRSTGPRVLALDDFGHCDHYAADLVLNQNLHATTDLYPHREEHTHLLLGTRFALLRREFRQWTGRARTIPSLGRQVLITLGGTDPDNFTLTVLQSLDDVAVPGLEAIVTVGASNPHRTALEEEARACQVEVRLLVNATNMPELMNGADLAIAAGGTTLWERAFLGLPGVVVVLADNQRLVAEAAARTGLSHDLGWHADVTAGMLARSITDLLGDETRRRAMSETGQRLVDGEGVERVLMRLSGAPVRLRRAREDDAHLLWLWANDPETRARAFCPEAIPWEDHIRWLAEKLRSPDSFLFIGVDADDEPVGQVRLDAAGSEAVISVSVDRTRRGAGWGTQLICEAVDWALRHKLDCVHAYLRPENGGSLRTFEKAGFVRIGWKVVKGTRAIHAIHGGTRAFDRVPRASA